MTTDGIIIGISETIIANVLERINQLHCLAQGSLPAQAQTNEFYIDR